MTEEIPQPKRRGRPPAPEDKKRRHNLTFRIRSDLKQMLDERSKKNGRSISEEIESIIERGIEPDATLKKFYGSAMAGLMLDHFSDAIEKRAKELANISQDSSLSVLPEIMQKINRLESRISKYEIVDRTIEVVDNKDPSAQS